MKYFPDNSNYSLKEFLSSYSATLSNVLDEIDEDKLNQTFKVISKAIKSHNTIFTCGNGGSSSIAEHLVCDFVKGSSTDSIIDPKVIPLLSTPLITAVANDIDYEEIFSYQLKKYATKQDVLLSVSFLHFRLSCIIIIIVIIDVFYDYNNNYNYYHYHETCYYYFFYSYYYHYYCYYYDCYYYY